MIRGWLANPWETAAVAAVACGAAVRPVALAAAAALFCALEIAAGLRRSGGPRWIPSIWPAAREPLVVVYDGECRLCVGSKERIERWETASAIRFVPLQAEEARTLLPGMDAATLAGAMHVAGEGRVWSGAEGWFRLMRLAPVGLAWIAWVTPLFVARPVYRWIARNRIRWFGRVCEGDRCAVHPRR